MILTFIKIFVLGFIAGSMFYYYVLEPWVKRKE